MSVFKGEIRFGATPMQVETGRMMKQADGAIVATVGGTVMLVAVTHSPEPLADRDFFPLMVDYREKFYASGRIPGGFFKRETKPGDLETLRARITDRAIRPLFPEGLRHEVMVYITIVSSDNINAAEVAALNATSLALRISSVPFATSTAAVRVGRIDDKFIINPTIPQLEESDLDLLVAGTKDGLNMVECGSDEIDEQTMIDALKFAHEAIVEAIDDMEAFVPQAAKPKFAFETAQLPADVKKKILAFCEPQFEKLCASALPGKDLFADEEHRIVHEACALVKETDPKLVPLVKAECDLALGRSVRKLIIEKKVRTDGRKLNQIRQITCEAPILPATHGSALFTRGQTQALGVVTLGTVGESQMMDTMLGTWDKHFLLHYNFPPFSVGEAKPARAPGRREIGHGALAERALLSVIPDKEDFPYTIRMVSEILESNGSSSMATVCVGTLSMLDAGVPLKAPVAGIAMGLVADDQNRTEVLTDIAGVEDHLGDMDFKVAGTREGITALQMDIKIQGITFAVMEKALHQAKEARLFLLDEMAKLLPSHRTEMAKTAPRVTTIQIPVDKIGALIGPGGKTIRGIIERTGVKIDVEEDGKVFISAHDADAGKIAEQEVRSLTAEVLIGQVYEGRVNRITDFGAFVELIPGKDGMVHISELALDRVESVESVVQLDDLIKVKVVNVDPMGKVRLSRKAILAEEAGIPYEADQGRPSRGGSGGGGRGGFGGGGGRGGDRGGRPGGGYGDRDRGPRDGGGDRDRGPRDSGGDRDRGPREGGDRDRGPRDGGGDRDGGNRDGGNRDGGDRGGWADRGPRDGGGDRDRGPREGGGRGDWADRGPRGGGEDRPPRDAGDYGFREKPRSKD